MIDTPLDEILGSMSKVRMLRAMLNATQPVSGRQAARLAGASMKARVALDDLADAGLITRRESTGQFLYSFNYENCLADSIVRLFQAEVSRTASLLSDLRTALKSEKGVTAAAVFGSAARGEGKSGSDLDLLVVVKTGAGKAKVTDALLEKAPSLFSRYGIRLAPIVLTEERWQAQRGQGSGFAAEALRDARMLLGEL